MFQAIQTKLLGPTNTRGARVKAIADAGSITVSWDYSLGIAENHEAAAVALARRYGWPEDMVGGGLPGRGYAFVRREPATADMLAALKGAARCLAWHVEDQGRGVGMDAVTLANARAVIAKAGG